ncbi:hypothetical protein [Microbacterium sp. BK668]|uniref:hypothetical protein n=1 Tax=Microbacterium sp. BK668 TaxID=2512118 RepID=UPI001060EF23|nr:hypothetical protein [Microbacterium sp. BK668]
MFTPSPTPSGAVLSNQLRDFFLTNPLSAELWLVAPTFAADALRAARASAPFRERLNHTATLDAVRLVTFDAAGVWEEIDRAEGTDELVTPDTVEAVRTEGLRIMFREGHGLSEAHAGLHYRKPSGAHTRFFLRAGPVVARSPLAHFVATSLLPWASTRAHDRIWVDTSAIAAVGYALSALLSMFEDKPRLVPVDSFGGYERLSDNPPDPVDQPLVLISASTSGNLARDIHDKYGIALDDIMTLFYVGVETLDTVLCDLTRRVPEDADEYKVDPIPSWRDPCPLCDEGLSTIALAGEEFVPEAARASVRMLKAVYAGKHLSSFVRRFYNTGAIRVARASDAQSGKARTVSIDLRRALAESAEVRAQIEKDLKRQLPAQVRWIVTLGDPDSNAVAELAKQVALEAGLARVEIVGTSELDSRQELGDGHAFVVAGTIASGRALLNVSRQLRYLHDDHIHYFVVCARPRSEAAWKSLTSDLRWGEGPAFYPLHNVWFVESEPDRGEDNPWLLELAALRVVHAALPDAHPDSLDDGSLDAVAQRIDALSDESSAEALVLFPASDHGGASTELTLNPNFAFWKFRFENVPGEPTQDEVFFTMATVLHNFRYSAEGRYALFSLPGHGYVLDPLNFGRFNDPVIQGAILRAAKGVELDYRTHVETSRQMTDEVLHLLAHHADIRFGGASTEFALSVARGLADFDSPGALRLHRNDIARLAEVAPSISPREAPLLSALLRYIAARSASSL